MTVTPPDEPTVQVSEPADFNVGVTLPARPTVAAAVVGRQQSTAVLEPPDRSSISLPPMPDVTADIIGPPGGPGPPGPEGPPGPQGPPGTDGIDGGAYRWVQATPDTTWTIVHSLGYWPNVTAVDTTRREIVPEVNYPDVNTIVLVFSAGVAGEAYVS